MWLRWKGWKRERVVQKRRRKARLEGDSIKMERAREGEILTDSKCQIEELKSFGGIFRGFQDFIG